MKRWIGGIVIALLLAGGAVLCVIRWQAWFGMPAEPRWFGDTIRYEMPHPAALWSDSAAVSQPNALTALVLGDIHNNLTCAEYNALAARVPDAGLVIQVGDWMDRGQFYFEQLMLREWTCSTLYGLPVIACPGNHEYSKGLHKQLSQAWTETFPHPSNGPVEVPGATYFVDMPRIRFIVLDTNPLDHIVYLTRTLTWMRKTMNSAGDRYIVVLMHHPALPVGKGRFNALIYAAFRKALGETDLVIAGHDHSYMRTKNFVVLNAAGIAKPQQTVYTPEVSETKPVYGVLSYEDGLSFSVHRMSDGTLVDSLYVNHD